MTLKRPKYIDEILISRNYPKLIGKTSGKAITLISGGIDSTVAMVLAKSSGLEVIGLEFFYEGRPTKEITNAEKICKLTQTELYKVKYPTPIKVVSSSVRSNSKIDLSEANMLYYSIATAFAHKIGFNYIIGGQILNDWFNIKGTESTPDYYSTLNRVIKKEYPSNSPEIIMPLIYLNKTEVVRMGLDLKAPLNFTWSCPENDKKPCMKCVQCIEREEAFDIVNNENIPKGKVI